MKKIGVLIGIASLLLLAGCDYFQKSSKEVVVAECYGKYLYESDLKGIIPEGASIMDSIQYASTFIDSWIRREVLIHQAESNLNMEELDLKRYQAAYDEDNMRVNPPTFDPIDLNPSRRKHIFAPEVVLSRPIL